MKDLTPEEYRAVAALVCWDIDLLWDVVERNPEMAVEAMCKLKERKDRIVGDRAYREMRYGATGRVLGEGG